MNQSEVSTEQGAVDTSHGQIQWHSWSTEATGDQPPLIALHPMPHDGQFFAKIAPWLAQGRRVCAPDYPGYGGSEGVDGVPTIDMYAEAMMETVRQLFPGVPVDTFGFHTGCLVAVEMALRFPDEIRRLVLVDVPYFSIEKRREYLASDWATGGFIAAFNYPNEQRFPAMGHDTLVVATNSSLFEPSRQAANRLPSARLVELPEVEEPALDSGAEPVSAVTRHFLET